MNLFKLGNSLEREKTCVPMRRVESQAKSTPAFKVLNTEM